VNDWQQARQLAWILGRGAWPDGTLDPLFPSGCVVVCTPETMRDAARDLDTPFALITIGPQTADEEEPSLEANSLDVHVVQHVEGGGELDQAAVIGGLRSGGAGASRGRGVLEICERVKVLVGSLTGADGLPAVARYSGALAAARGEGMRYAAARRLTVQVAGTRLRTYPAPRRLVLTPLGGGSLKADWTLPPNRYDRRRVILRWAAGSTPPASATAGTDVAVAVDAVTATWTPGAGTVSVAVFEAYDETGSGTDERTSDPRRDAYDTATVT